MLNIKFNIIKVWSDFMNKKVLLVGSTQTKHIAKLFENNGVSCVDLNQINRLNWIVRKINYIILLFKSDIVYCVGGIIKHNWVTMLAKLFRKKLIIHWIGTDVLLASQIIQKGKRIPKCNIQIAGSDMLVKELKQIGIEACQIPIVPFKNEFVLQEMPKKHSVLVYLPEGREEFYGSKILLYLAEKEPNIFFHIVANKGVEYMKRENIIFHGFLGVEEMKKLYEEISILFRYPKHDGLSMMVIEALGYGKHVLYKYKHPFVSTPKSEHKEEIYITLKGILDSSVNINKEGHDFVKNFYSSNNIMKLYEKNHIFDSL